MFDGLKDKIDKFRKGAEEAAETKPEDQEESTADSAADDPDTGQQPDSADQSTETDTTESESADQSADPSDGQGLSFTEKAKNIATAQVVIKEEELEDPLWELEMALLESDVELEVTEQILMNLRDELLGDSRRVTKSVDQVVEDALRDALLDVMRTDELDFDQFVAETDKPVVIIFTGVNGVGKTTSIAKLARYLENRGYDSVLANGDTFRAGANEQLEEHAEMLDKRVITHEQGGDPAAVIYDAVEYAEANDVDVVLGDTAGRLHTSEDLMDQLAKIDRVVGPDLTIFVDEAVAGQDAVRRAEEFHDAAAIDGTILTKADADPQGGAAISISHVTGKPILFLGTGQQYDDLAPFDPEWLVNQLIEK